MIQIPDCHGPRPDFFFSALDWSRGGIRFYKSTPCFPLVVHKSLPYLLEPVAVMRVFWVKQKGALDNGTVELLRGVQFYEQ
jgi:hypothetical protein